jgi:hypothetical protein
MKLEYALPTTAPYFSVITCTLKATASFPHLPSRQAKPKLTPISVGILGMRLTRASNSSRQVLENQ